MGLEPSCQIHPFLDLGVNIAWSVFTAFGIEAEGLFQGKTFCKNIRREIQKFEKFLIESQDIQISVDHGNALVHAFQGCFQGPGFFGEFFFRLFTFGDVGENDNRAAVVGFAFGYLNPPAVGLGLFKNSTGIAEMGQPFGKPLFLAAYGLQGQANFYALADDVFEQGAGKNRRAQFNVGKIPAIGQHQPFVCIVESEAVGNGFNGVMKALFGPFAFGDVD